MSDKSWQERAMERYEAKLREKRENKEFLYNIIECVGMEAAVTHPDTVKSVYESFSQACKEQQGEQK